MTPARWSPRPLRALGRRLRRCPFAQDLRQSALSAVTTLAVVVGAGLGLVLAHAVRSLGLL